MSTKTSHRDLAKRQREALERLFPKAQVDAFARLMNPAPTDPDTTVLPPCEQDTR